ncbi:MAG: hypothetical protein V9H26_26250 [Verrucomicrobiota bacterium]|nr:hypothetical protein [Limisphaerales bacterium]
MDDLSKLRGTNKLVTVINKWLACVLVALTLVGCKSSSPSQYISPRITGRVVDRQSREPIAGVQVRRVTPRDPNVDQAIKGGQVIETSPAVRTGSDGGFVLASERDLALFRRLGWYSVSLSFTHPNYHPLSTEFTLANATNTPSGEPLVRTGDIGLQPKSK